MTQKALLLIDIQRDYFAGGAFPLPGMEAASQRASELLSWFRAKLLSVIHVRHTELDPAGTFFVPGTAGVDIHKSVAPIAGEIVIDKNFPNSFRETSLLNELKKLGVKELVVCGAMSNMCIDATARAAVDLGFRCTIAHDACAASVIEFNGEELSASVTHTAFMGAFASAYGAVVSVKELLPD